VSLLISAHVRHISLALAGFLLIPCAAIAGGPKYVAGVTHFNSGVLGQPIHWAGGRLNYYVDRGPLTGSINNQQAVAMVDAAATLWNSVPTAGVTLTDMGALHEDVSGANIVISGTGFTVTNEQIGQKGVITAPSDITPSATSYPLAVIFDADGSVIDAVYGTGTSQPSHCQDNGVMVWFDNLNPDATIAHSVMIVNGLCATDDSMMEMMNYELERGFGRILGLDYAQVTPDALADNLPGGTQGWPVMQPLSGTCSASGGICIPNPAQLQYDDIAALNRIYPITAANLPNFLGKQLTAANTVSITGTISFKTGLGMQGVNVVARPLDASGNPLYQYTVSFVSGTYFTGNHGNPVTGWADANDNLLTNYGSNQTAKQGYFDLSGIPLPAGVTTANYEVSFEAINPLYILTDSVGPYALGQVTPSGTLQSISVPSLTAGSTKNLAVNVENSAVGGYSDAISSVSAPRVLPASGMWCGRLSQVGQSDWFTFPVRGGHTFTVVTQALDETGAATEDKAMPAIGVWDAFDPIDAMPIGAGPGMNGLATGESWLQVTASGDDRVRIGIADQRGDGRPDYAYNGWVLYADSVAPTRLPASGGPIVIHGMGFRLADTVQIGGQQAMVTSISPNEITAIAPAAATGVTGSVNVEVDDLPLFNAAAIITGGISYDSGSGDALTLNTAPMNTIPIGVPEPFSVTALGANLYPAGGVTVIYSVVSGTATLACGQPVCTVTATGDGHATMNVTAVDGTWSIVTAALINGSSLQAQFAGGTPPTLASLTPMLSLAAGSTINWTVQTLVLNNGAPLGGQTVNWQTSMTGIAAQNNAATLTGGNGIATKTLTVGPLAEGQQVSAVACLNGTNQCVTFLAYGARAEYATVQVVSGATQTLALSATPTQIVLRLLDMDGNPMAGGTISLYQAIYAWAPPCPTHGVCTQQGELLAQQAATATSALDGTVSFTPAALPGIATSLLGLAVSGSSSSVNIAIEQRP